MSELLSATELIELKTNASENSTALRMQPQCTNEPLNYAKKMQYKLINLALAQDLAAAEGLAAAEALAGDVSPASWGM